MGKPHRRLTTVGARPTRCSMMQRPTGPTRRERRLQAAAGLGRSLVPLIVAWVVAGSLVLALLAQRVVPFDQLVLDPNQIAGVPWYVGLLSNLGMVGWSIAAAASGGGAWVSALGDRHGAKRMLRGGAILSILLLLDDLFQIHILASDVVGVSKPTVMVIYGGLSAWWVVANAGEILRTRVAVFSAALVALSLSVVVDRVGAIDGRLSEGASLVLEDGFKFLGIVAWAQYYLLTAADIVRSVVASAREAERRPAPSPVPSTAG